MTIPRDNEKALARRAMRAGISRAEYVQVRTAAIHAAGKRGGWRPSEIAATVADVEEAAVAVYDRKRRRS